MATPQVQVERTGLALTVGVVVSIAFHAALFSPQLAAWFGEQSRNAAKSVQPFKPTELDKTKRETKDKPSPERAPEPKPAPHEDEPKPASPDKPPEPPPEPQQQSPNVAKPVPAYPDAEEVSLGSDTGDPTSLVVIGRDAYEEHMARLSEVDQAAFRMGDAGGRGAPNVGRGEAGKGDGGGGGAPSAPVTTVAAETEGANDPSANTVVVPPPDLTATPPEIAPAAPPVIVPTPPIAPIAPPVTPAPAPPIIPPPVAPPVPVVEGPPPPPTAPQTPVPPEVPAAQLPAELKPQDKTTPPLPVVPPPSATPPVQTPASPAGGGVASPFKPETGPKDAAPGAAGTGGGRGTSPVPGSGGDGALSDLESPAASKVESLPKDWQNGKLVSARGIQLKTRRPLFDMLTQITSRGRPPIVSIWFNGEGTAVRANIDVSSGSSDIDGPILDSLYRWRATGKQINELKPNETVKIQLRLLL